MCKTLQNCVLCCVLREKARWYINWLSINLTNVLKEYACNPYYPVPSSISQWRLHLQTWVLYKLRRSGKCSYWYFSYDSRKLVMKTLINFNTMYHGDHRLWEFTNIPAYHCKTVNVVFWILRKWNRTSPWAQQCVTVLTLDTWSCNFYISWRDRQSVK